MHYMFYLLDGVFKFVPHSFLKGNIEKKKIFKKGMSFFNFSTPSENYSSNLCLFNVVPAP